MKRSGDDRKKEINELADWCEFITRFIYDRPGSSHKLGSALSGTQMGRERGDLGGLRMVYRDTNEWARGLGKQERDKLDLLLKERFGHGLVKGTRELRKQTSEILKRGSIKEADEYRILESRLDSILDDPSKQKEVDAINSLLGMVKKPLLD